MITGRNSFAFPPPDIENEWHPQPVYGSFEKPAKVWESKFCFVDVPETVCESVL
jgi:hypothetical protein